MRKCCPLAPSTLNPGLQDGCQSVSKFRNGLEMTGALGENPTRSLALHSGICKRLACFPQTMSLSKGKCPTAVPFHFLALLRQFVYLFSKCLWLPLCARLYFQGGRRNMKGKGGPGKPLDKPIPNRSWLISELLHSLHRISHYLEMSQRVQARSVLWACLLVAPTMYPLPIFRCWPDTGQEARIAFLCGS